jgi:hypothetical protein
MPHTAIATHNAIRTRLAKLTKLLEEYFFVRLLAKFVNVDITDDALLVDDEQRPFRKTGVAEDAIFFRDVTVWPEIRKQG